MVFAGIVFLCSIFFVLGMLVGRSQGQKFATVALAEAEAGLAEAQAQLDSAETDRVESRESGARLEARLERAQAEHAQAEAAVRARLGHLPSAVNFGWMTGRFLAETRPPSCC